MRARNFAQLTRGGWNCLDLISTFFTFRFSVLHLALTVSVIRPGSRKWRAFRPVLSFCGSPSPGLLFISCWVNPIRGVSKLRNVAALIRALHRLRNYRDNVGRSFHRERKLLLASTGLFYCNNNPVPFNKSSRRKISFPHFPAKSLLCEIHLNRFVIFESVDPFIYFPLKNSAQHYAWLEL